jgi:hypothetical protein
MILLEKEFENVQTLSEGEGKEKALYIKGIFAQTEVENKNKRSYSNEIFEPAAQSFNESMVKSKRALGELDHPSDGRSTIDATRSCMLITEFAKDGNNYMGKARILQGTPMGDVVAGLINNDVVGGVSTRGSGAVKLNAKTGINEVQKGFKLHTVDYVLNPSAPDAFVSSILESDGFLTLLSNHAMLEEFDRFLGQRKAIANSKSADRFSMSVAAFDKLLKTIKA